MADEPQKTVVLVVDDEPLNRELLRRVLQREYAIEEAEDAETALAVLARRDDVRLILCDHLMPGRSGTELAAEVRARYPGIEIMLLTGYDEAPEVIAAREAGLVCEVVAKPWRGIALKERIAAAIR